MTEKTYLSSLLNSFELKKNHLDLRHDPNYEWVQDACSEFFNGIEKLENKAIIKYFLDFDFTKLFYNENGTGVKYGEHLNEKETEFFICLLALTIDKFGVDQLIKDMLPEHVKEEKLSLFRKILSFFRSLFYKKNYIDIDFSSPIYQELNKAVWDIRYTTKKTPNYSKRGDLFFAGLFSLAHIISHKFAASKFEVKVPENMFGAVGSNLSPKEEILPEKLYTTVHLTEVQIEPAENMPTTVPSPNIDLTSRRQKFMDGMKERCILMMEKEKEKEKQPEEKVENKTPVEDSLKKIEEEKETKNNQTKKRSGLFYGRLFQTVRDNFTKSDREQLIRDMKKIVKVG